MSAHRLRRVHRAAHHPAPCRRVPAGMSATPEALRLQVIDVAADDADRIDARTTRAPEED